MYRLFYYSSESSAIVMSPSSSLYHTYTNTTLVIRAFNIGIKHGYSCINIRQVPREVLKTEAGGRGFQHCPRNLTNVNALENALTGGRGFQHHPRDLANVNALENHVRSLLLHKN